MKKLLLTLCMLVSLCSQTRAQIYFSEIDSTRLFLGPENVFYRTLSLSENYVKKMDAWREELQALSQQNQADIQAARRKKRKRLEQLEELIKAELEIAADFKKKWLQDVKQQRILQELHAAIERRECIDIDLGQIEIERCEIIMSSTLDKLRPLVRLAISNVKKNEGWVEKEMDGKTVLCWETISYEYEVNYGGKTKWLSKPPSGYHLCRRSVYQPCFRKNLNKGVDYTEERSLQIIYYLDVTVPVKGFDIVECE